MSEIEEKTVTTVKTKNNAAATTTKVARKVRRGMFDTPEIVAVGVSAAALLAVVLSYFFLLLPAREQVKNSEQERRAAQAKLAELETKASAGLTTQNATADLIGSVERFEVKHLTVAANGNAALYARLNQLIKQNNLRNTAGPEYSPLEVADATRKISKGQSLFPGTRVSVTVEGNYASLRRFIADLENTNQFLIINAVELESNDQGAPGANANGNGGAPFGGIPNMNPPPGFANPNFPNPNAAPANPVQTGKNNAAARDLPQRRGAVSLRLQMASYFRRNAGNN